VKVGKTVFKKATLFLFNDSIYLTVPKRSKFIVKTKVPIVDVLVWDVQDTGMIL